MPLLAGHGIIFCGIEPAVRKEGGNSTVFPDGAVFPAARHCNRSAEEQINIEDAHRRLLADLLIPYLDTQDFHKTPSIFQAGKNDFFQTRMGASDCVACAAAVELLKSPAYEEAYPRLLEMRLEMRKVYARAVHPSSKSLFLFQENSDYLDELLSLLQHKPDQREDRISRRIAGTEFETSLLWTGP